MKKVKLKNPKRLTLPSREFWDRVFPKVYKYYKKKGLDFAKKRGYKNIKEIASATTASIWHEKISPKRKAVYEKVRRKREVKSNPLVEYYKIKTNPISMAFHKKEDALKRARFIRKYGKVAVVRRIKPKIPTMKLPGRPAVKYPLSPKLNWRVYEYLKKNPLPRTVPYITKRDFEILKMHWAGKKYSMIVRKFKVTKGYISELVELTRKGYRMLPKVEKNPLIEYYKKEVKL